MKKLCSKGFEKILTDLNDRQSIIKEQVSNYEEVDDIKLNINLSNLEDLFNLRLVRFDSMVLSTTKENVDTSIIEHTREVLEEKEEDRKESKYEKYVNSININDILDEPLEKLEEQLAVAHMIINLVKCKELFSNDIVFYLEYLSGFNLEISFHKYREYDKAVIEDIVNKDYLAAYYIIED